MKTFTFRFDPSASPSRFFGRVVEAARTRKPDVNPDVVSSNSVAALLSTMTAGRIELFYAIAERHPESMYQLAQMVKRDPANVLRDVKALEGLGLVGLEEEKAGERVRMRPVARYDRVVFDFGARKARSA